MRFIVLLSLLSGCHALLPLAGSPNTTDGAVRPDGGGELTLPDVLAPGPDARPDLSDLGPMDGVPADQHLDGVVADQIPDQPQPDVFGPLTIVSDPVVNVSKLMTYKYDAEVNTNQPVTWSLLVAPSGMTIDAATGLVTWPPPLPTGTYPVELHVTDGAQTDTQLYSVKVWGSGTMNGLRPVELADLVGELNPRPLKELRSTEPDRTRALSYVVSCALEAGTRLAVPGRGGAIVLEGALGLAPRWRDEPCDVPCQEWVSACLAARVNTRGRTLRILLAGPHPALPLASGAAEGVFFGNLFAVRPSIFSCRAAAAPPPGEGRLCALGDPECAPITNVGICPQVCQDRGCRGGDWVYSRPITVLAR